MKATFLCTSLPPVAAVLTLPCAVLRELRPVESCSGRDLGAAWCASEGGGMGEITGTSSLVSGGGGRLDTGTTGVESVEEIGDAGNGSSIGGNGRAEISGRGLKVEMEVGVDVARCGGGGGGHSGRAGNWGIFSFCKAEESLSLSLSLVLERPLLMRLRKAFIALV